MAPKKDMDRAMYMKMELDSDRDRYHDRSAGCRSGARYVFAIEYLLGV